MDLVQQALLPYNVALVQGAVQKLMMQIPFEPRAVSADSLHELCVSCLHQTASAAVQSGAGTLDTLAHLQRLQQANEDAVKLAVTVLMKRTGSIRWQHQQAVDSDQEQAQRAAEQRACLSVRAAQAVPSEHCRSASPSPNRM